MTEHCTVFVFGGEKKSACHFILKCGTDIPVCGPSSKSTDKNVCATFLKELVDACKK